MTIPVATFLQISWKIGRRAWSKEEREAFWNSQKNYQ